jgi:DNA polymerase-3 subunit delta
MPGFKPAYLIHGDDHGRISERRARLRALAEAESGPGGVEVFEDEAAAPDAVAAALSAMTLGFGRRFVIVDGVESWKDGDLAALEAALASPEPETTVAFFAREDQRAKAPARLHAAVQRAGGDVRAEATVRAWELPKWVAARARELGLELEPGAAKTLVAQVGERQGRLSRELEKLALALGPGGRVGAEEIDELVAGSAERRGYALADALLDGDAAGATRLYLQLRAQGERLPSLLYAMTRRVREALAVVARLDQGEPAAQVKRGLRMPPRAAERFIEQARRADAEGLRRTLEELADLELDSRGGAAAPEDTSALRTLVRAAR